MLSVLIIEDDTAALELARDLLKAERFEVYTATGGEEGRETIRKHTPDLIVLDLGLPDDFGLDICRETKQEFPGILIFILTALGNSSDVVAGLEAGADDYMAKPFNPREFVARIQILLKKAGKA